MHPLRATLCLLLISTPAAAQTSAPLTPQMSPIVTWDPDRTYSRPPTKRALTAAELQAARTRADRFFDLAKATPIFSQPTRHITSVAAWPVVGEDGSIQDRFIVYWSAPMDVTRRADGSMLPKMGGAHTLVWFRTNYPPLPEHLEDRTTRGNFSRGPDQGLAVTAFAQPRTFGDIGGGTLYNSILILTRDGRPALEPAPLGALLEVEIARYRKLIAELDQGMKRSLDQLEASMTPDAKAERRARRAERWKTQYRNPNVLAQELDAADRSDEASYQTEKARFSPPATRDPRSVYWGPRMALEAVQHRLTSLDAAGRNGGACGRTDSAFDSGNEVRYEPVGSGRTDCIPMVRIRQDLVDPKRPAEAQLLTVWLVDDPCGEQWIGKPSLQSDRCAVAVPLLRELDWAGVRGVFGW